MKIWTKAFWKDAVERLGSTFFEVLVGALIGASFSSLTDWGFWKPVLWTTVVALIKVLAAGFINPNTGASLGTTNPAGIVKALATQKDIVSDSSGMVEAKAGDTVAGKASPIPNNTPVDVVPVAA